MSQLLITIPICREDATRAELLLDLIYQLDGKKTKGHCLLVFTPEVHQEMKDKLKIAASLAFEGVHILDIKKFVVADSQKYSAVWSLFYNTAQHVAQNFNWPWLWVEPDCMPVAQNWREKLCEAYYGQPKRYLSRWMKAGNEGPMFCHRIGVYPVNVLNDINAAQTAQVAYDQSIVDYSSKSELFQQVNIISKDDVNRIRQDAVLIHHDKTGVLADWVRSLIPHKNGEAARLDVKLPARAIEPQEATEVVSESPTPKRRGRPPKAQPTPV